MLERILDLLPRCLMTFSFLFLFLFFFPLPFLLLLFSFFHLSFRLCRWGRSHAVMLVCAKMRLMVITRYFIFSCYFS